MTQTHWTLAETLRRHGQKVPALAKASGLSKNTVYDILNGKSKAVTLETLDKLLGGLEQLTGLTLTPNDLIARDQQDPYDHLVAQAKPYDPGGLRALLPNWTEKELAEDDRFWQEMREEKLARLAQGDRRMDQIMAIFEGMDNDADEGNEEK